MKRILFFICAFAFSALHAQITLEDVFRKTELNPQTLKQLQWIKGTDVFCWVANETFIRSKVGSNQNDSVFKASDLPGSPKRMPQLKAIDAEHVLFQLKNEIVKFNHKTKTAVKTIKLAEGAENIDYSTDFTSVAYTFGKDLFLNVANVTKLSTLQIF
jgi:hypothetical protein